MRLISILLVLVLIAFLVMKQLNSDSSRNNVEEALDTGGVKTPKVPTSPEDIQEFEEDINKFMQENTEKRNKKIEESLAN